MFAFVALLNRRLWIEAHGWAKPHLPPHFQSLILLRTWIHPFCYSSLLNMTYIFSYSNFWSSVSLTWNVFLNFVHLSELWSGQIQIEICPPSWNQCSFKTKYSLPYLKARTISRISLSNLIHLQINTLLLQASPTVWSHILPSNLLHVCVSFPYITAFLMA